MSDTNLSAYIVYANACNCKRSIYIAVRSVCTPLQYYVTFSRLLMIFKCSPNHDIIFYYSGDDINYSRKHVILPSFEQSPDTNFSNRM